MTYVSPLLQSRLNAVKTNPPSATNNRHEKIYQDLQKRAHEAKPNEAKAQMVNEGILGNPITAVKDTFQDGANFIKAVKTGELGDNNLGRINDFGLKVGAGLIAAFLAAHSKTKTDAIMQFVGGGTFIAAMSLWPKLFINLPARIVHGFRIDRKYISAQGDKKDFFLDNQFLVWDAYPEEQLRKDAKNAGIDYDAKNGKEKIQRKMQKTALQNRTLWMATAGFATPLMTSMVGNFVEPKIKEAVVKSDVKKSKAIIEGGLKEYLATVKPDTRNVKDVEGLIAKYSQEQLDDDFFKQLAKLLSFNSFEEVFKDSDDAKVAKNLSSFRLTEELEEVYKKTVVIKKSDLMAQMPKIPEPAKETKEVANQAGEIVSKAKQVIEEGMAALANAFTSGGKKVKTETKDMVDNKIVDPSELARKMLKSVEDSLGDSFSIDEARKALKASGYPQGQIDSIIQNTAKDNSKFMEFVKKYNTEVVSQLKGRAKAYLDILNPIVGSKAESQYTLEFEKTMKTMFEGLGIKAKDLKDFREKSDDEVIKKLSGMIQEAIKETDGDERKYKELLARISNGAPLDKGITDAIGKLAEAENIKQITPTNVVDNVDVTKLNEALLGGEGTSKGLFGFIKGFISKKNVDTEAIKSKAIICANFERRVLAGEFKGVLSDSELEVARKMIYDGTISTVKNKAEVKDKNVYANIVSRIFDNKLYNSAEKEAMPGIENVVENLKTIFEKGSVKGRTPTEDYLSCGSASKLVRDFATRLGNNKSWMKIFGTMSIALVAITLLVQPLFGKIDKEFPKEGKNGGAK